MKHIKTYARLNEAGWDSSDEFFEIEVNGVKIKTYYSCFYDTPDNIALEIYVIPTPSELAQMGVWSENYVNNYSGDERLYIYTNGIDLKKSYFKKMGFDSVRDMSDSDIFDYFKKEYSSKITDKLTSDQFVALVKQYTDLANEDYDDIKILSGDLKKGYGALGKFGVFDNPDS